MSYDEQLPYASELDLRDEWRQFSRTFLRTRWNTSTIRQQAEFAQHLRTLVADPEAIAGLVFCADCGDPEWDHAVTETATGLVCESCWDEYEQCAYCEQRFPEGDLTETLSESVVCDSCRSGYYTYCDECEGYYPDDYAYEHEHSRGDDCCTSPELAFTVRNDGAAPLANDTRIKLALPAGTISTAGLQAIGRYLRNVDYDSPAMRNLAYDVHYGNDISALGNQWQTKTGNFAKRLSRHAYQAHRVKLSPEVMSKVGTIARDHSNAVDVEIEVTRDFNQSASYFYHSDSCYWGAYSESRCALKSNGAFGIRSFDSYGGVAGRAWVMPLRRDAYGHLTPTFNAETPDAFVVFNGYGDLGGYAGARIMAHMAGWTYRKIGFECEPMYINAGGYLVAPEEIAAPYTGGSLTLDTRQHADLYERETSHVADEAFA